MDTNSLITCAANELAEAADRLSSEKALTAMSREEKIELADRLRAVWTMLVGLRGKYDGDGPASPGLFRPGADLTGQSSISGQLSTRKNQSQSPDPQRVHGKSPPNALLKSTNIKFDKATEASTSSRAHDQSRPNTLNGLCSLASQRVHGQSRLNTRTNPQNPLIPKNHQSSYGRTSLGAHGTSQPDPPSGLDSTTMRAHGQSRPNTRKKSINSQNLKTIPSLVSEIGPGAHGKSRPDTPNGLVSTIPQAYGRSKLNASKVKPLDHVTKTPQSRVSPRAHGKSKPDTLSGLKSTLTGVDTQPNLQTLKINPINSESQQVRKDPTGLGAYGKSPPDTPKGSSAALLGKNGKTNPVITQNGLMIEQIRKCIATLNVLAGVLGDEESTSLTFETKSNIIKTICNIGKLFGTLPTKMESPHSFEPLKVVSIQLEKLADALEASVNYLTKNKRVNAAATIRNLLIIANDCLCKSASESELLSGDSVKKGGPDCADKKAENSDSIEVTNKPEIQPKVTVVTTEIGKVSREDRIAYYKDLCVPSAHFSETENFPKFNTGKKPLNPARVDGLKRMVTVQLESPAQYQEMCEKLESNSLLMNGSLNIDKLTCNRNGKSTIICETEAQKESLKKVLSRMELEPADAKIKNFFFAIFGVLRTKKSEDIVSELLRRDKERFKEGDFEISERFPISKSTDAVVFSCKESMRTAIVRRPKIYLGSRRYQLNNFVELTQCYKCSRFGHKANCCTEKTPSCPNCAGNHSLKDCPINFSPKCSNCSRVTVRETGHSSWDVRCPYRKMWIKKQKSYFNG